MSSNLARSHFQAQFALGFRDANASLQAVLPSPDAVSLDERLLSQFQDFNKVIEPLANVGPQRDDAERCSRDLLWNLSRGAGLTLRVLEAAGHVAQMDKDGLTTSQLIACINSILGAGLKSKRVSATSLETNSDIIQAAAQAIPGVIDKSWPKLRSKVCLPGAPSADDVALLDGLIRLSCIATELIECGHVNNDAGSTESEALRELKSEMSRSQAFEELMLQFVIHRNNSSGLKVPAITNFSGIFGSGIPNLSNVPPCLNELGAAIKSILVTNNPGTSLNRNRYSPTVDMMYTILSSDQLRGYFQVNGSTQEGSDDYPSATSEKNELFDVLSEGYWEWLKGEENRMPEGDVPTLSIRALIVACCLMSFHLSTSLIIFERSFLPLVARGLLAWQWLGDNALSDNNAFGSSNWQEDLSANLMRIGKGLQAISSDLSTKITISTGFIDTMNALQRAQHLSSETPAHLPLSIWKEFCEIGEVNERACLQERRKEWANRSGARPGCQWAKCPLFGTETFVGEDWFCKGCRKAVYCGEFCWKSDFAAHSAECSGSVSRRPSNRDRRGTREPQLATG